MDLLGIDSLTSTFGLLVLFRGIASVLGPPLGGLLYESTNQGTLPAMLVIITINVNIDIIGYWIIFHHNLLSKSTDDAKTFYMAGSYFVAAGVILSLIHI